MTDQLKQLADALQKMIDLSARCTQDQYEEAVSHSEKALAAYRESQENIRIEFEAWADNMEMDLSLYFFEDGNNYQDPDTRFAFEIWCASRGQR